MVSVSKAKFARIRSDPVNIIITQRVIPDRGFQSRHTSTFTYSNLCRCLGGESFKPQFGGSHPQLHC